MGFPVFCQSLCIKGTTKTCLGTINHPIHFGGVEINPGDLIMGDSNGVVVVARGDVPQVIDLARQREEKERRIVLDLKQGRTTLELYAFAALLEREGLRRNNA
jgi:4-hydroxy-4-methyl-2-oxoglutarate aldolase